MSFDVAADAYDRFMGRWSRLIAPAMADLAPVGPADRVLDVGCGPGALTAELVARIGPAAVAAVDPSEPFVAAVRAGLPGGDARVASAAELPFEDAAFRATLAQLVVHFMADPVGGIAEMARVTAPGGTCVASVWDFAGRNDPLGPFWEAARSLDPGAPGEAVLPGARQGHLVELFGAAGLRDVRETTLVASRTFASFDEWWAPFEIGAGAARRYLASLGEEQRQAIRERCRSMLPEGGFELTARAWAATGTV
ncbi:MAG TPA: methyltransferase domain-containing protein [Candidatus Limnocylindrales bacterium]